eukprot:CAMPEP_0119558754 /NCGR_PEP_ID=MMETSP1352-20130426/11174_1 /TAXON_ID=265584 /ORGANISM="Stauroneis constricta, Strain CCMP1120" /LENGTH=66 /DNA_ID=CAMNT_0007606205 /DNA_START=1 /DNA_END=201 /DNA_ORIENTATION=+
MEFLAMACRMSNAEGEEDEPPAHPVICCDAEPPTKAFDKRLPPCASRCLVALLLRRTSIVCAYDMV